MTRFTCDGTKKKCLNCPLTECIRDYCMKDNHFVQVKVVRNKEDRREYHRDYYQKNRERILERRRRCKEKTA